MSSNKIGKVIVFHNNKGGTLKTTTCTNVGGILSKNKKVVILDLDPQGNTLLSWRHNPSQVKYTIFNVLTEGINIKEATINVSKNIDVVACNGDMNTYDYVFATNGVKKTLKETIAKLRLQYDYVLIDTSASLGLATLGALNEADKIVLPFIADTFGAQGIVMLQEMIEENIKGTNKGLKEIILIPTMWVSNSTKQSNVVAELKEYIKDNSLLKMSKGRIRRSVVFANSILEDRQPITLTRKNNLKVVNDLHILTKEVK